MTTEKATLIAGLNEDLAAEYQAMIMYNTYAGKVVGIYRKELEGFFRSEIPDEIEHAEFLANKIAALGGTPGVTVPEVEVPDSARGMLEAVLKAESDTIERYTRRRKDAETLGDVALVNDLEEIISDETKHKEECEKMLRGAWD